ncbi:flagellar M-ring protein FliF [Siccirubricoccus sp. KC 17139]|uniref:Flagellar M-ring protein n=1 Tax=Siccirubricoccus soli TaxID=2899147 RepID=A0ABT1DDA4_9PROT|nr:flagellar basal-body MS-ring/collar protein FliF [Siccirubricoccus soli]MCO6419922.1 flagellar M-ring protein FliF [Siccirubricoccus soli]MCP2686057.1 flagellar M-ring protein FliF [Siccirubricoccus soli]
MMAGVLAGLQALGPKRLAALAAVGVGLLVLLAVLAFRAGDPPMAPLFGELETRDAAAVVAALDRQRVPYRIVGGGTQVLAPADQIPRLRLMLAREGLPAGGGVGWEIFDRNESLTTSPFQQDMNRLRAMEGELARTIRGLAGVRAARVHLVLPRREAFSRERGEAQASVVLAMQGSQRLDREGVQAVLHLVATAVPGLRPQNVSIVDSRGELLARGGQALTGPSQALSQEELRRAQELRLGRAVEELLERSLGPGRVRAETTVELDFDRIETREERFDPENQVPRSQQSASEQSRNSEPQPTSVAGNIPGAEPQQGTGTSESRTEETTNFEIGRTNRTTLREGPVIRRLSVAVLVDGVTEPQEGGPPRWRERTPEELARLATLVRSAVGFDERRGDRVEVVSMRFAEEAVGGAVAPEGFLGLPIAPVLGTRLLESLLFSLVALAAILLIGKPMVGRITAALVPQPALAAAGAEGAPLAEGGAALTAEGLPAVLAANPAALANGDPEAMIQVQNVHGQMRASAIKALTELIDSHPDEAVSVLRRWLNPEDAS